jgi:hypothetical protein
MTELEQARALARYAFSRLWRSEAMTPRAACAWLRARFGCETVDNLTAAKCMQLVESVTTWWSERCANPCKVCRIPVRQDHAHEIVDGELYHANCVPSEVQHDAR